MLICTLNPIQDETYRLQKELGKANIQAEYNRLCLILNGPELDLEIEKLVKDDRQMK